jgi:GAF domain-containing protein
MPAAARPGNEAERLRALDAYRILDTAPEPVFNDLVTVAAHICGAPMSLITLVDDSRQWFKARVGLELAETRREHAFCAHAILDTVPLVVPDATTDSRFADNPYVVDDPSIRFYAGAPLTTPDGHALGTLCVLDCVPRELTPDQLAALQALARQATALLEWRRTMAQLAEALTSVRTLEGLIPICSGCKSMRDDGGYWQRVEAYLAERSGATFSHGLCPNCVTTLYPDV